MNSNNKSASIGAFFDFDETLLDTESSRLGFKYLWERRLISRRFIAKVMIANFFYKRHWMSDEKIAAIPHWATTDLFNDVERAVLTYTDALVLDRGRVPDGVFEALKSNLSDEEILEFTYITCTYMMHGVMSRALRLEYDDVDEPVVEVPAP